MITFPVEKRPLPPQNDSRDAMEDGIAERHCRLPDCDMQLAGATPRR